MDYFSLLGLTLAFDLDLKSLEAAYFAAQRASHPDRFVGKPATERQAAMQRSVDINNAYQTLKEPLPRAQYLLQLQGIAVGTDAGGVKPSTQLLMEVMEWREQVAEEDAAKLQKLDDSLNKITAETINNISVSYKKSDWQNMAQETIRLGYLLKTGDELRHRRLKVAS